MEKDALLNDVQKRVERIQNALKSMNVDACILSTAVNVFYATGRVYNGYAYIPQEGKVVHFVKRPQIDLANAIYVNKPELIIEKLKESGEKLPQSIMAEVDALSYNSIIRLSSAMKIDPANTQDASYLLRRLRAEKTDYEVEQTKLCAKQHVAVYKTIPSLYKQGMTDIELQIEIEKQMRLHGSIGLFRSYGENMDIFMGSLLAGDNADVASPFDFALGGAGTSILMPLGACGKVLKEGQSVMVDMAGNYGSWMTDMTRVFSIGKLPSLAYDAHQLSIDIQNKLVSVCEIGFPCAEMYNIADKMVKKEGLEKYFMGHSLQAKFVGHGVGLEINELPVLTPRSKEVLTSNMVIAIEPKFVLPNIGAVGIENTFVVSKAGLSNLTECDEQIIEI